MKAIVANVLFGGIFGCLSCANSTQATPVATESTPINPLLSASLSSRDRVPLNSQMFGLVNNVSGFNSVHSLGYSASTGDSRWLEKTALSGVALPLAPNYSSVFVAPQPDCTLTLCDRSEQSIDQLLSSSNQPYTHESHQGDLVVGFQPTFWSSENRHKYWGVTTIEHWGNQSDQNQKIKLPQLNYINSSPILASGSSSLTFSGGGNHNLAKPAILNQEQNTSQEFEDFRGGITYHHGIAKDLTMGVGFVYDDLLVGFTQLTYDSQVLPIKTTISVLTKESATDLHSHVRFKPTDNFVVNYYGDAKKQKFDANWGIYPGLNLIARANSKDKSYSTGMKIAVRNNYFALTATAALDHEQNLQWQLNSQIGGFKFAHSSNKNKSKSELSNQLLDSDDLGFQCSAFFRYQTRQTKKAQQEFVVWGGKLESKTKIRNNKSQWSFDLGYGSSSHGTGWIAHGAVALQPNLFFNLDYQEVSATSDETKIKLQLSSN